jgi:DNA-binding PadR family transcriptional regulator
MIPLYILGLLQRFGPQHGYQIKKIIAEQLSDFTQIKLPTIYYHLEKMGTDGLLESISEKPGSRPEKTVYSITENGVAAFRNMLEKLLVFDYKPAFPSDAVFYFYEHLESSEIANHLEQHSIKLKKILAALRLHKEETQQFVPEDAKGIVSIIFSHHEHHYQAELDWASETLNHLKAGGKKE